MDQHHTLLLAQNAADAARGHQPSWAVFVLIAVVTAGLVFAASKLSARTLASILGIGCLLFFGSYFLVGSATITPGVMEVPAEFASLTAPISRSTADAISRSNADDTFRNGSPVTVSTDIPLIRLILIVALVIALGFGIYFAAKKQQWLSLAFIFLLIPLLIVTWRAFNTTPWSSQAQGGWTTQSQNGWTSYPPLSPLLSKDATPSQPHLSNEALWDRLTQSKINLEAEADNRSRDDSEDAKPELSSSIKVEKEEPAKPEWVDWPPKRVGNVYRQVIVSDRYSTEDECFAALEKRFQEVVRVRMQKLFDGLPDSPFAIPRPAKLGIGLDYIMGEICREQYIETVSSSVGDMKRVHVLMEFDTAIDNHLRASWQRYERLSRLATVGGIASLALGGLALVFGLLKFDTWTRGYYTKRLLIGVPAAIIVLVLLFVS